MSSREKRSWRCGINSGRVVERCAGRVWRRVIRCRCRVLRRGGCGMVGEGVVACASGVGCVLQSIVRNTFGYVAISIVLNRKTSFYVIAEKWLKRNYTMKGRDWEGERRGGKRVRKRDVGRVCRGNIDELVAGRMRAGRARVASDYAELFRLCSYLCRVKTQTPLNMQ